MWLALLTGHLIADFVLQSGFVEERRGGRLARHGLVVAAVTAVCLQLLSEVRPGWVWVIGLGAAAGVLHAVQDRILPRWLAGAAAAPLARLGVDQALHGLALWGMSSAAARYAAGPVAAPATAGRLGPGAVAWSLLFLTLGTAVAAVVIAHLLEPYRVRIAEPGNTAADDALLPKAGLWIGLCERFLLLMAIAWGTDVVAAVGLLMGVKSVYRFRELDRREKAEYYLLGTLLSVTAAVGCGLALRWVLAAEGPLV